MVGSLATQAAFIHKGVASQLSKAGKSTSYRENPLKQLPCLRRRRAVRADASAPKKTVKVTEVSKQTTSRLPKASNPTETTTVNSVAVPPPVAPVKPYPGTPLMWVGVGVAATVAFLKIAGKVKEEAQKAAMAAIMKNMGGAGGSPFGGLPGNPFGVPGSSPFPTAFQTPPPQASPIPTPAPPKATATAAPEAPQADREATESKRKTGFTDVDVDSINAEEAQKEPPRERKPFFQDAEVVNDSSSSGSSSSSSGFQGSQSGFTVEMLERMMEDPLIQKMIYPYLPEEMRNPATFKWMMQNPMYRQQLETMLQQMGTGEGGGVDPNLIDMMKKFDINSPEIKEQFDQIGMTPEDVITKIMSNPEVANAFKNPKVQAAILDCSTNPLNITKYQNDKEIMDVFMKISELFPGMTP